MSIKKTIKKLVGQRATKLIVQGKYALFNGLCGLFPMNNEIIFESHPDMSCNSYALFQYMLSQGLNKKYRLTWLVRDMDRFGDYHAENVDFLPMEPKSLGDKIKTYLRCNRAKAVFSCHTHVSSYCVSKKQINVFLDHGSHLKDCRANGKPFPLHCGYLNCQSEFFVKYNTEQYTVEKEQVIHCGLPRNDLLFTDTGSITRVIPHRDSFRKVILWAPTFRRHHGKERVDCDLDYPLGLPVLYSQEDAVKLNRVLSEHGALLVIKPHPSSDMSVIKELSLSNVVFLYNQDLDRAGVQLNEFLAQTDAMITDYSSIYYDYLLLDRPLALTFDDYDQYASQKGFVFDDPKEVLKGEYLYNVADMCRFAETVSQGLDVAREERRMARDLVHTWQDDKSCERVYRFLMEKLGEI